MPNFGKLVDQAKKLAGKHPDQVNKVVDKAENAASEKTGGKYDSQIQQAGDQAEGFLGTKDQGTPGQATPGQGAGNQ
jgi:hypothetical protein